MEKLSCNGLLFAKGREDVVNITWPDEYSFYENHGGTSVRQMDKQEKGTDWFIYKYDGEHDPWEMKGIRRNGRFLGSFLMSGQTI